MRILREMSHGQVLHLKPGLHRAKGPSKEEKSPDRFAFFIRLSDPKPEEAEEGGYTTGAAPEPVTSIKYITSRASPERGGESSTLVEVVRKICPPLKLSHIETVELKVGHGIMIEEDEELRVVKDIYVLCTIHCIRPKDLVSDEEDANWAPPAGWAPPDSPL